MPLISGCFKCADLSPKPNYSWVANIQFYMDLPCFIYMYSAIDMILLSPFWNWIALLNKIICFSVFIYSYVCFIVIFGYQTSQFLEACTPTP